MAPARLSWRVMPQMQCLPVGEIGSMNSFLTMAAKVLGEVRRRFMTFKMVVGVIFGFREYIGSDEVGQLNWLLSVCMALEDLAISVVAFKTALVDLVIFGAALDTPLSAADFFGPEFALTFFIDFFGNLLNYF